MLENHNQIMNIAPYSLDKKEKKEMLKIYLNELTRYHYKNCSEYKRILEVLGYCPGEIYPIEELPYLPVRLFKKYDLLSVDKKDIVKTMTSSGTSGQDVSKIYLDSATSRAQTKVLTHIVSSFIGNKRLPMIILDTEMVKKDRSMFSARGAGIIGFSMFGRNVFYALDKEMKLDIDGIKNFVATYNETQIVMFGYTYMIWQYFMNELKKSGISLGIREGLLFHVGGWKKLQSQKVDTMTYNQALKDVCGNISVHNYYGMAEQLGSIFIECEYGHKHCSIFSDVLIRNPKDFSLCKTGERGLMELLSVLPSSYPGHILLTEDEGEIIGEDDCPCGRMGKYFMIHGRVKNAEIRGCSDTYER